MIFISYKETTRCKDNFYYTVSIALSEHISKTIAINCRKGNNNDNLFNCSSRNTMYIV